jgi:acyl carrier protein
MPSNGIILSDLLELLRPFAAEGRVIVAETELVGELGLNSLKVMDLLMEIEDKYDITVPLNILPDVRTVGDLAGQLEKLLQPAD